MVAAGPARADDLDVLHERILQRPGDAELNFRFARLAEDRGYLRWALAAYERVVLNDPSNTEAQNALQRVRRALQPDVTLLSVQLGGQYQTNPRYYLQPRRGEYQAVGSVSLLDDRGINGMRWRTTALAGGYAHQRESDLNYGFASLDTGPVLDVIPGLTLRPAVGGSAAYFDHRFYYGEGAASLTWETNLDGIYRSLQLRGAYRSYDDFFPSSHGFYGEARGRVAIPNVLGSGNALIVSPWVLWSDISGTASVVTPIITELQPGAYLEWGSKFNLVRTVTNWLVVDLNVSYSERDYRNDIVFATGDKRSDRIVSPGVAVTIPNLFAYRKDLRLDYKYLWDDSNDPTKSFVDHVMTVSVVALFDPTRPFAQPPGPAAGR